MTEPGGRYLGVDLAWVERNRTGLAVLDGAGRLVASTSVRSDDEIVAFVRAHTGDTVVAAVDAPLVVPNETGRRPCEAEVGRLFGRYSAGAHPANRGMPWFRPEPRGARLAARLGWDLDPTVRPAPGRRVCVEVYPHPAMVVLFGLDRVIPYKQKRGRDLPALVDASRRLVRHVETTCGPVLRLDASPRWTELREVPETATRKSRLRAVEDEVDAVFCAYLAWLWATQPDRMLVLGDAREGAIVTPRPEPAAAAGSPPARGGPPGPSADRRRACS